MTSGEKPKNSREKAFWRDVSHTEAARVEYSCYGDTAGEEVLIRALYNERDLNIDGARFWLRCYLEIDKLRGGEG